jgi:lipid-A-disaccharide synthase
MTTSDEAGASSGGHRAADGAFPSPGPREIPQPARDLCLFLVAGEHSGDALGARLMAAIEAAWPGRVRWLGVGGPKMQAEGLTSQFPLEEVAVMGFGAIVRRLPSLLARVHQTAQAAIAARPDAVVIIDSPEFTHPIARRIRRRRPDLPIVDYVSPTVWAWRPGRARRMRGYIDHVLALLPFEPEAHRKLGGPPCTYVGHPLIERLGWIDSLDPAPLARRLELDPMRPVLVVLPGSRRSEVERLMGPFGETLALLTRQGSKPHVLVPTIGHVAAHVAAGVASWPLPVHILEDEADKWRAFKLARAALAASGTVSLELALTRTPMVIAYRVEPYMAPLLRRLIKASTIILPNLILGRHVVREYVQEQCTPERLAEAVASVLADGPARTAQLEALSEMPGRLRLPSGTPSEAAATIVLDIAAPR